MGFPLSEVERSESGRLQAANQEAQRPCVEGLEERHLHHQTSARI